MPSKELEKAIEILNEILLHHRETQEVRQAIKIILKELERLQEENTEYRKQLDLDYVRKNFIHKNEIIEIIENKNNKVLKNTRTLEQYKKDVFDKLTEKQKLEFIYNMSKKLCLIEEIIKNK